MRIASDFHDYYDIGMGEGLDLTTVYRRYREEADLNTFPFSVCSQYSRWGNYRYSSPLTYDSYSIGFCGKVYLAIEMVPSCDMIAGGKKARSRRRYCYSLEDIDNFVRDNFKEEDFENYSAKGYSRHNPWPHSERRHEFKRMFDERVAKDKEEFRHEKWFIEKRCPVFVAHYDPTYEKGKYWSKQIRAGKIWYNAPIQKYDFMRVFPPYEAFQEISMWLNNQAVPIMPIPEIPDEVMAEIKGFDPKHSFRKERTSKRWKNKK